MLMTNIAVANPAAGLGGGGEKHEIYAATFGGHLFYDIILQGQGGGGRWPPSASQDLLLHGLHCLHINKLYIMSKCIEVYEEIRTWVYQSLLIAIKF